MWNWPRKRDGRLPPPLSGAPAVRRQKTYTGDSGYVYEYVYEGCRPAERAADSGTEYLFSVSSDRKNWFPVPVFLEEEAVRAWDEAHTRSLNATERYAIVKLALFHAFDERDNPSQMRQEVRVRPADVNEILEILGFE